VDGRARVAAVVTGGTALAAYALVVRGSLTVDLGIGRSVRPLGPFTTEIAAPREIVFDVIADPYLRPTPRALASKLRVVERGEDMVLAEHFTRAGLLVTTTLETVRFERPERIHFRLVRGPVPYVVEEFHLRATADGTALDYRGELGADLWALGRAWASLVAPRWELAVRESLASVRVEAHRRAARRRSTSAG
jgi:Polyketide cyclase / dehydrase and lipid transport